MVESNIIEKAKWISSTAEPFVYTDQSVLFRKVFEIKTAFKKAQLSICALGLGIYTINGAQVTEDVLCTPFTRYDKRVLYQNYDITKLLKIGMNAIGVHVGNGFYNNNMKTWNDSMSPWRDGPKLIAAITIVTESGEMIQITSDRTWKWFAGPCVYNHMRQGEHYDARLMKTNFDLPAFQDNGWKPAVIAHPPGGKLELMNMEPVRIIKTLLPVKKIGDVYDFGVNLSGWVKIKCKGEKGRKIVLTYDEQFYENQEELREVAAFTYVEKCELKLQDIYIMKGSGLEEYSPNFCYHGFRYVRVVNQPENFEIEAQMIHTDFHVIGNFICSNDMLNKIHEACVRSTLTNYVGIPTDCPHREQNGWTGDALISADQSLLNFDMEKAYRKWLNDFQDVQRSNGQLPGIVPSAGWGYNWGSGPAWDSALIQIPWKFYLISGKIELIENMWEHMCRYMNFMESMAVDDIVDYGLGDWCCPSEVPQCPTAVTDTSFYYADTCLMSKMASLIGRDAAVWNENAIRIKETWRRKYLYDDELKKFQTFWACAIYQGLLEDNEKTQAVHGLVKLISDNDYRIACGTLGIKFMLSALSENGYANIVYKMISNPNYPSYAYWINHGMTTLCENWDMKGSRNHHMFSEVDHWFYRYLGGICFDEEGLRIEPCLLSEVLGFRVVHRQIVVERDFSQIKVQVDKDAKIIISGKCHFVKPGTYTYVI